MLIRPATEKRQGTKSREMGRGNAARNSGPDRARVIMSLANRCAAPNVRLTGKQSPSGSFVEGVDTPIQYAMAENGNPGRPATSAAAFTFRGDADADKCSDPSL
jgi:hypothetical protein